MQTSLHSATLLANGLHQREGTSLEGLMGAKGKIRKEENLVQERRFSHAGFWARDKAIAISVVPEVLDGLYEVSHKSPPPHYVACD